MWKLCGFLWFPRYKNELHLSTRKKVSVGPIETASGVSLEIVPKLRPLVDIGFGYARSNVGGSVVYLAAAQSDPLPRNAAIGTYIEVGTIFTVINPVWKPLSFMIVREAEDILVNRRDNGTWEYTTGLGDIRFIDNVLLGKALPTIPIRDTSFKGINIVIRSIPFMK